VDERGDEVESTFHAAGIGADRSVKGIDEVDQLAELADAAVRLAPRQPVKQPLKTQQLGAGLTRVERRVLQGHADAQADGSGVVDDVEPGDRGLAAGGREQRAQHPHHRRLAGTVRTEEPVDLPGGDVEIHPVHRRQVSESAHQRN